MTKSIEIDRGRRAFLKGAALATVGPLIVTDRTIAQTRTIYVNTWGGSWTAAEEAAFFKPFTDQTGIRVKTVAPVFYAKLKAQVQSGSYEWDITAITQADLLRADREGLLDPIDWSVVKVWWTQGNQSQQLMRDGEVDMMVMWNARASELAQQGHPVELVWHGATITTTMWGVAKNAPNRKLAWEFLQFAVQAKPQADFANRLFYGPTNPDAFTYVSAEVARQLPTYPENAKVAIKPDTVWEADNTAKIQERFTQWLAV